ncbi:glycerol-3-phosphate dehydrogenase/oxidase [Phytomonospora endophytica]|uniref:Glycerol-3-phosphate dehydrogenase n=1 Tax=Phytomonospora endophytica TaxID=714109 RepID=A0A841FPW0_9ACTN|nr:glycerol-3-phosphate dehydrogenase/oxidase [Phytomonospora endophytica]MBB6038155.1 glycerol-3-phosphate dehydrogenase [Phytomonospora endophytica]GIG67382.1 FAD-dependent oxidoreductase [Phytomonospora endophytica]
MARHELDPARRAETLRALRERDYDVIVIGGGVTGAGAALDAVSRGLSVALLEAADLANGTSSRSGKLFHGGLRYLKQLNFSLVREALKERDLMVGRLCPHLVSPERFTFPFTHWWERVYIGLGVLLYDLLRLTVAKTVKGHRHLSRKAVRRELPALRPGIRGGVRFYDVRVDDARHTMTLARTAAGLGADVATRAEVTGFLRDGERVTGVRARDAETGEEFEVRGRSVVNATGVWAERVQELAGAASLTVTAAKGIHLVVPADRIDLHSGLMAQTPDSVFIIRRWFGYWLIGTTDTRWDHSRDDPAPTGSDVDYLLAQAARWLEKPLTREDVVGVYAGLRPLVGGKGATAGLSRDHTVVEGPQGMYTVVGGKYTTYRIMAREAVDAAASRLGREIPGSVTETLPILGAEGFATVRARRELLAARHGLSPQWIEHLLSRYGSLAPDVLDLAAARPELARPIEGAPGYLAAEAVYAASAEGALHLDDVLVRRTRVFMETPDHGLAAAGPVATLIAPILGWDDDRREREIAAYTAERAADRAAVAALTDDEAVAARAVARGD